MFFPYLDFLWEIDTTDPISIGDNQHFQGVNQSFCGKIIGYNPILKYTFLHIVYPTIGWNRRHTLQLDNKLPYLEDLRNCNCLTLLSWPDALWDDLGRKWPATSFGSHRFQKFVGFHSKRLPWISWMVKSDFVVYSPMLLLFIGCWLEIVLTFHPHFGWLVPNPSVLLMYQKVTPSSETSRVKHQVYNHILCSSGVSFQYKVPYPKSLQTCLVPRRSRHRPTLSPYLPATVFAGGRRKSICMLCRLAVSIISCLIEVYPTLPNCFGLCSE